jgi:23S rRNA pseudouridine955/2504/2580 synthase
MASVGHPLVGDGKYGSNALNKPSGYKTQALCSYKLTFHFAPEEVLAHLDGKSLELKDVWFLQDFYDGKLGISPMLRK